MGAAASIDNAKQGAMLASQSANAASLDFQTAYSALQAKVKKSTSEHLGPTSIHMLALRQLSQKLKNQENLERSKRKVLKSRSVPFNMTNPSAENGMERSQSSVPGHYDDYDDLDHEDVEVVHDAEFVLTPPKPVSRGPSTLKPFPSHRTMRIDEEAQPADEESSKLDSGVVTSGSKPKKKPMLMLQVSEHFGDDEKHTGDTPKEHVHRNEPKIVNGVNVANADSRISPNGTLYMGKVKVLENGIVSEKLSGTRAQAGYSYEDIKRNFRQDRGYIAQTNAETGRHSWVLHRNESGRVIDPYDFQRQQSQLQGDDDDTPLPSMSKKDFIEIATLGSGASGVVSEAIHVPTLTLVALKMLPVYNHEKRLHVSRELGVLYRNLAEMRLVDDLYGEGGSQDESDSARQSSSSSNKARCPNVLSLYNAFKDPSSGMINLVVEYMDGGSLEDLVRAGGCQDERILADIAFQTLTGLAYLHKNKNVHRDIKPANILCSSSGLIKIADFGISKALDKTTGFANSFVGTVSYMSP